MGIDADNQQQPLGDRWWLALRENVSLEEAPGTPGGGQKTAITFFLFSHLARVSHNFENEPKFLGRYKMPTLVKDETKMETKPLNTLKW